MQCKSQDELMDNCLKSLTIPKVVVQCPVYNHVKFSERCFQGVLIQETDSPFEVFVHDDASTDGRTDIIRQYAAEYPQIIEPVYETEPQHRKDFEPCYLVTCAPIVSGGHMYIAYCEEDNYWTDLRELQKRADYMESPPNRKMAS